MSELQEEILAFSNKFHEFGTQTVEGTDCIVSPFPYIDPDENKIVLELTGTQITELLSSIQIGAEWAYPDRSQQILFNFMKGLVCAPTLDPEGDCNTFPASAPFIKYFPDNPFVEGDVAEHWNFEAWHRWFQFDTIFPDFVEDWLNGALNGLTQYQDSDVMFNISSLLAPDILAFLTGGGLLPKIEIRFKGTGHINLTLLSFPLGGKAVVELDTEPNILDILTGGVIDPAAFMVELNRDIVSFPPDEYPIVQIPIEVTTGGDHVLYICYIPTLDDAAVPILLGGGLRSIEMCGFTEMPEMGIEQIIWDGCTLKSLTGGVETDIVTAAELLACMDIEHPEGGGGGGGGAALSGATRYNQLSSTINFTNTAYARLVDTEVAYTFTKSKALIGVGCSSSNAGSQSNFFRPLVRQSGVDINGVDGTEARTFGTTLREVWAWDYFEDLDLINSGIFIDAKVSGSTGAISNNFNLVFVIIEFEDISELFVEDIRISGGELQKKIAGVWIDVTDSFEAIIANLQSQVSAAASAAASANATNVIQSGQISSIISVNATQNGRLTALESDVDDLELDAAAQAVTLGIHESRLDALEAGAESSAYFLGGVGSDEWQFDVADSGSVIPFVIDTGTLASVGIASVGGGPSVVELHLDGVYRNNITHVGIELLSGTVGVPLDVTCYLNGMTGTGFAARVNYPSYSSGVKTLWMRVPNSEQTLLRIEAVSSSGIFFYVYGVKILYRGDYPTG